MGLNQSSPLTSKSAPAAPSEQNSSLTDRSSSIPFPSVSDPFQFPSVQLNNFIFHLNAFLYLTKDYISQSVHFLQLYRVCVLARVFRLRSRNNTFRIFSSSYPKFWLLKWKLKEIRSILVKHMSCDNAYIHPFWKLLLHEVQAFLIVSGVAV